MSNTSNLVLPFLAVGQAQKHVTVNESLRRLDAVVQLSVVSATTAAQPSSPADGSVYIVPAGKSGADWSAYANESLGYYRDAAWEQITPREGWLAYVKDTDVLLVYGGAAWALFDATKLAKLSATDRVLGRVSSGAGAAEEITFTDQAQQLADDTSFQAMCATLVAWRVLAASAVAASHTGNTTGTALATIALPAGAMGPNGVCDRRGQHGERAGHRDLGPARQFKRDGDTGELHGGGRLPRLSPYQTPRLRPLTRYWPKVGA